MFQDNPFTRRRTVEIILSGAATVLLPLCPGRSFGEESGPKRTVMAHWHFFPISIDNEPFQQDYYTLGYMRTDGEGGKHAAYGGLIRDRPIPRAPIQSSNWRLLDALSDIHFAQDAGLTAFQFNICSLSSRDGYISAFNLYISAAEQLNSGFSITPCIDCTCLPRDTDLESLVAFLTRALRRKGALKAKEERPVLSAFAAENWPSEQWKALLDSLGQQGVNVYFAPMFVDPTKAAHDTLARADMIGWWCGDHLGGITALKRFYTQIREMKKDVLATVWPQDCRYKDGWYAESRNSEVFRQGWSAAIEANAEYVNVLTWNDYSESSHLRPSLYTQYAFADLNRLFSDRFLRRDKADYSENLFYFHRIDTIHSDQSLSCRLGSPTNEVELLACLEQPGELRIDIEGTQVAHDVASGMFSLRIPAMPGRPRFGLRRKGRDVLALDSAFTIRERSRWPNYTYRGGSTQRKPLQWRSVDE